MTRVLRDHSPQYADPIGVRAGDRVRVGRADVEYPQWRWCTAADGREGWIPERWLGREGDDGIALRDYTARELSVRAGAEVEIEETCAGWAWVTDARGSAGWIPERCLPRLREGTRADAPAVSALHIASWQATYRGQLPETFLDNLSPAERTAEWQHRLAEAGTRLLLLEGDAILLGFAAFGPSRDADADPGVTWELYNLHLRPERRGGGLGRELFDEVVAEGRRAGRRRLTLWVAERNWPARRFYERQGMRADGVAQTHRLGSGADLLEVRYIRSLE